MTLLIRLVLLVTICIMPSMGGAMDWSNITNLPSGGVVRDEAIAVSIAEVILVSVYGADSIKRQMPLKAELERNEIWLVSGTFPSNSNTKGGIAYIRIRKKDGAVLGMIHGK